MSVEVAVVTGERYQKEKRVKKEKETTSTEEGVPLINVPNYCQFLPSQQMVEKEEGRGGGGEGETGDEPAGRQNRLNQSDDTMMEVGSVISEADSASVTGNSIPDLESNGINLTAVMSQLKMLCDNQVASDYKGLCLLPLAGFISGFRSRGGKCIVANFKRGQIQILRGGTPY